MEDYSDYVLPADEHPRHVYHIDEGLARDQRVEGPVGVVTTVHKVELHGERPPARDGSKALQGIKCKSSMILCLSASSSALKNSSAFVPSMLSEFEKTHSVQL